MAGPRGRKACFAHGRPQMAGPGGRKARFAHGSLSTRRLQARSRSVSEFFGEKEGLAPLRGPFPSVSESNQNAGATKGCFLLVRKGLQAQRA